MLDRVQISDYRCLRDVDVPLKPLTILIGPNNTGKSSFLSALELFRNAGRERENTVAIESIDFWQLNRSLEPTITGFCKGHTEVQVRREKNAWRRSGENYHLVPLSHFDLPSLQSLESQGVTDKEGIPTIDDSAQNVPAYLDALLRKDRTRFFIVLDKLKALVPGLSDLDIATPTPQNRRVDLKFENGVTVDARNASTGVKLLIFFVCVANHPQPPKTILLEEPENSVHPKRLGDIVNLLIGMSEGKFADVPYTSNCDHAFTLFVRLHRSNQTPGNCFSTSAKW